MPVSITHLKAITCGILEQQHPGEQVEEIIDTFVSVLEENGGRISFAPSPLRGPAKVVHVGVATSRETSGK